MRSTGTSVPAATRPPDSSRPIATTGARALRHQPGAQLGPTGLDLLLPADVPDGQDQPGSSRMDRRAARTVEAGTRTSGSRRLRRGVRRELRSAVTYPEHDFGTTTPITVSLPRARSRPAARGLDHDSVPQRQSLPWCTDASTTPPTDNSTNANGCVVSITRSSGSRTRSGRSSAKAKTNGPLERLT